MRGRGGWGGGELWSSGREGIHSRDTSGKGSGVGLEQAARWSGEAQATVLGSVPEDLPQLQEPSGSASARGMCSLKSESCRNHS